MLNALLLLANPGPTWKRILSANRPPWTVFVFSFLPVLLVSCALESWMLWKHGTHNSDVQRTQHIPGVLAMRYGTTQFVMGLISLLACSVMVWNITKGVAIRTSLSVCFTAMAYALSVAFLIRMLDAWDFLNTWVIGGVVVVSLWSVLYTCISNFIRPDPAKAFGLYVAAAVIASVCMAASHIFSHLVLRQKLFPEGLGLGVLGF